MSDKLLNESTIRKFMRLANIELLADGFINEAGAGLADQGANKHPAASKADPGPHKNKKTGTGLPAQGPGLVKEEDVEEDEEIVEEGLYDEDLHAEAEHEDAGALGDELPVDELPADEGPAEAGLGEEEIEGLVAAIADAIESHTGVAVDVAGDEEAAPEMGDVAPEDAEGGEELPAPEGDEEEGLEGFDMIDEESVVNETFRRVKNRLRNMKKEEQLLESLTKKIYARLAKKNKK